MVGSWTDEWKSFVLAALEAVGGRLGIELNLSREQAFQAVYGYGFTFKQGCSDCSGLAITRPENRIDFRDFWKSFYNGYPDINIRLIVHELGHAFDHKVCQSVNKTSVCQDWLNGPLRTKTKADIAANENLARDSYGAEETGYSGFAGGQWDWQYTLPGQLTYPGEIWADMYLGWVYDNLGADRRDYMNQVMPSYLHIITGNP